MRHVAPIGAGAIGWFVLGAIIVGVVLGLAASGGCGE